MFTIQKDIFGAGCSSSFPFLYPRPKLWLCWLLRTLLVCVSSRDQDLISKCGDDARIYVMFQYHFIIYVLILCIPSLGIILPINYTGNVLGRQRLADPRGSLIGGTEFGTWGSGNLDFNPSSRQ